MRKIDLIRREPDAPGGLAFFEWVWRDMGKKVTPRIHDAVLELLAAPDLSRDSGSPGIRRRPTLGTWAENDWETVLDSFRRARLRINNPNTREAIRQAVGEWLAYRAALGNVPDGFEALEDYYVRPGR